MRLYQLTVHVDDAWSVMNELGEVAMAHFLDMNKDELVYNLPYTSQVKGCEDTERKLNYLLDQCKKAFIKVSPPENIEGFMS